MNEQKCHSSFQALVFVKQIDRKCVFFSSPSSETLEFFGFRQIAPLPLSVHFFFTIMPLPDFVCLIIYDKINLAN